MLCDWLLRNVMAVICHFNNNVIVDWFCKIGHWEKSGILAWFTEEG